MAPSGSFDYSLTAADIIQAALEDILVYEAGETVASGDSTIALRTLNLIVKQWQGDADMAQGLKVWTRQRLTLFLAEGQPRKQRIVPALAFVLHVVPFLRGVIKHVGEFTCASILPEPSRKSGLHVGHG